jgi:peptidoglycan/LPS O-acetylase OafA/YrhL
MDRKYISGLDGLRAIAVTWVFFFHAIPTLNWSSDSPIAKVLVLFSNTGWIGVQIFFAISGFLITNILINSKGKKNQLKHFFIRRSLRIFPLYFFTLAVLFIFTPYFFQMPYWLAGTENHQSWWWLYAMNWIIPFVQSGGVTHFWSLAIEEQFYLIWPFIIIFTSRRVTLNVILFMILSAPIFRVLFYYLMPDTIGDISDIARRAAYYFTICRWDAIAFGALLALLLREDQWIKRIEKLTTPIILFSIVFIVVSTGVAHSFRGVASGMGLFNQTVVSILTFIALFIIISQKYLILNRLLDNTLLKTIGKHSYAIYVFHLPILLLWKSYFPETLKDLSGLTLVLNLACHFIAIYILTFIAAKLSWFLLEHPFLKLKEKLAPNI